MMKQAAASGFLTITLLAFGILFVASSAGAFAFGHALPLGPAAIGKAPPQIALTASYSVVGGGSSNAQDLLTYISNGILQIAILTPYATPYMVDSGTAWSAQTILNGSSSNERWITAQDVSGTISAPLTVSFTYYHQYRTTFNFNISKGGSAYTGPSVTFSQMGSSASVVAPSTAWVDSGSNYNYPGLLPGSSSTERWVLTAGGSGTVSATGPVMASYAHELAITASYSIVDGGLPMVQLSSTVLGAPASVFLNAGAQTIWVDAGAVYSFTSPIVGTSGNERWQGTVLLQPGNVVSLANNGTAITPLTVTPVFYHQFLVNVTFNFIGGTIAGLTPPAFNYQYLGAKTAQTSNGAVWVDATTTYTLPEAFCCQGSTSERWELNNATSGTINRATKITSTYYHQFYESFSFSIVGQAPPSSSQAPLLTYVLSSNPLQITLSQTPQSVWADAASTYSVPNTLPGSTNTQRWFAPSASGKVAGPAPYNVVTIAFNQQYLLSIVGGGIPTQWVNAGNTTTLSTPGVFGRSQGTGFRVTSYQTDNGNTVPVPVPVTTLSIQISMNGPHTITFQSVRQFQLTLDAGATAALSSITPPTISSDVYWYDTGTPIQLTLNGAYERANGVGQRIVSVAATAQAPKQINSVGVVQVYSNPSIQSPVSITTSSITQYQVVLNSAASAALASITPASTFSNDTSWYDSGAPPVTVTLNAVFSRAGGTGFRVTSWQLDSGTVTNVASTGTITIATKAMTSPHFINATNISQYQVSIDKGGMSALATMTSTPIPSDTGWYDASSPIGAVMNGVWNRASGTGQRLAGYSINGGPQVTVSSTGLVLVLNITKLSSAQTITTSVVTQYLVVLDSGAQAALSSMSPPPIPKDGNWFDSGTPVTVSLNGIWGRGTTSGSRLLSYSVNQGTPTTVLSSGTVQALSLSSISAPETIATKTGSQYHLTSSPVLWRSVTNSTLPGDSPGWFDTGTAVKAVYNATWNQTPSSSRSSATSYSIDNGIKTNVPRGAGGTFTVSVSMNSAHSIALNSVTQYLLTVVGPPMVNATPPSPTGDGYYDSGSKVTVTVPSLWNASKPGVREILSSYILDDGTPVAINSSASAASFTTPIITLTKAHQLGFIALTQYQVAFQFFDGAGKNPVQPTDVQLIVGNATQDLQSQSAWFANGTSFQVVGVIWEGSSVGPVSMPSFHVQAAPMNITLNTRVYPASLRVVDLLGLPVSGAQVSMTLANGTTITGTTKGDGTFGVAMVPLGTYTAQVSSLGSTAQIIENSASAQAVAQARVALSLVSLFGIVAVVVGAAVTGVLVIRKRKEVGEGIAV